MNLKIEWYYLKHQDCVGFYLVAYNMHNGCLYLFRSNVLQVFLHHDLSQTGLNQSLGALSLSWPVYMKPRIINHPVWYQWEVCLTSYDYLYVCGFCEAILKQYHKDIKTKLLFDLNKQFEIKSQLVVVRANGKGALSLGLWCWVYLGTSVSSLIATQALIGSQGTELIKQIKVFRITRATGRVFFPESELNSAGHRHSRTDIAYPCCRVRVPSYSHLYQWKHPY